MTDYIYVLKDPITDEVRYVGKSNNPANRLVGHLRSAKKGKNECHNSNWIRKLLSQGLAPILEIILEVPAGEKWQDHEVQLIAYYRSIFDLTNVTRGGEGVCDLSPEATARKVAAWRKSMSDPEKLESWNAAMKAAKSTPEFKAVKAKHFADMLADPDRREEFFASMRTPEAIENRRQAALKRFEDSEEVARHSAKMKELHSTPEKKEEARQRALASWQDPEIIERRLTAIAIAWAAKSPEQIEEFSQTMIEVAARPEVKAAKSKGTKAAWQRDDYRNHMLSVLQSEEFSKAASERAKARWANDPEGTNAKIWTDANRKAQSERITIQNAKRAAAKAQAKAQAIRIAAEWIT